jgi:hypothetical protein
MVSPGVGGVKLSLSDGGIKEAEVHIVSNDSGRKADHRIFCSLVA